MPATESGNHIAHHTPGRLFLTTHWSVILAAKDRASPDGAQALEILCQTYWYPVYALIRGSGHSPEDAEDLTQGFFARLLAKDFLKVVEPERGRFRSFLRMAVKRFLAHEWQRARADKRGGGRAPLNFDMRLAEDSFQTEAADSLGPDELYDRRWALALLAEATARLEREYARAGKLNQLNQLKPHLTADRGEIPYPGIASALHTTEGAARVAVHRLRKRFRELFRETVAETVATPAEVEPELRYVLSILARG